MEDRTGADGDAVFFVDKVSPEPVRIGLEIPPSPLVRVQVDVGFSWLVIEEQLVHPVRTREGRLRQGQGATQEPAQSGRAVNLDRGLYVQGVLRLVPQLVRFRLPGEVCSRRRRRTGSAGCGPPVLGDGMPSPALMVANSPGRPLTWSAAPESHPGSASA